MTAWLKLKLKKWLLSQEEADLVVIKNHYEKEKKRLASLPVTKLVREQLKGFDISLLNTDEDLEDSFPEGEGLDAFLDQISELKKNTAFPKLCAFLIRNQILYMALEAESSQQMNFARATINGIKLVQEEIDRLHVILETKREKEEEFDPGEVV